MVDVDSPIDIRGNFEVRYAGVVVGRATQVRDWTATGAFIGFTEPLPSGTSIELRGENITQAARVAEVIESADVNLAGMRVSFVASSVAPSDSPSVPSPSPAAAAPAPPAESQAAAPAPAPSDAGPPPAQQGGGGNRKRRR